MLLFFKLVKVIVLGRNAVTGLIDKPGKNVHFVSRNHAEILIKDRKLFLKPSSKMKVNIYTLIDVSFRILSKVCVCFFENESPGDSSA